MVEQAGASGDDAPADPAVPGQVRAAVAVVYAESAALLALAVVLVAKTASGHPHSVGAALLGAALALVGALALGSAGRGLMRLRFGARTPVVVLELLALPVSYSLTFQAHRVGYGGPILIAPLIVLYLLFTPPARAALDRPPRA